MAWARTISSKADIQAALQRVSTTQRGNLAVLPQPVQPATEAVPDSTQLLPCDPRIRPLLPWGGLRRGTTIATTGSLQLPLLLLAGAMRDTGSWAAIVGLPELGLLCADELGVDLDRTAVVPDPGPDWPAIVAALIDGVDLVVVQPPAGTPEGIVRALSSRARQKGCVLIPTRSLPGVDLTLHAVTRWHGLRDGRGRLRGCDLEVKAVGRGRAVRPRTATISLGQPARIVDFPPPTVIGAAEHRPDNLLWRHVQPNQPPADPWARLKPGVAP